MRLTLVGFLTLATACGGAQGERSDGVRVLDEPARLTADVDLTESEVVIEVYRFRVCESGQYVGGEVSADGHHESRMPLTYPCERRPVVSEQIWIRTGPRGEEPEYGLGATGDDGRLTVPWASLEPRLHEDMTAGVLVAGKARTPLRPVDITGWRAHFPSRPN